jgi:Myosin N-terminal SH3-like domain
VWVSHETDGFVAARVGEELGEEVAVELCESGKRLTLSKYAIQQSNPAKFDRVEDLADYPASAKRPFSTPLDSDSSLASHT